MIYLVNMKKELGSFLARAKDVWGRACAPLKLNVKKKPIAAVTVTREMRNQAPAA